MTKRTNALLTAADREYIRKPSGDYSRQHRYERRESIQTGLEQTLRDCEQLLTSDRDVADLVDTAAIGESDLEAAMRLLIEIAGDAGIWIDEIFETACEQSTRYPPGMVLSDQIDKLVQGEEFIEADYDRLVEVLARDPDAFQTVFPDAKRPKSTYHKHQLFQELQERPVPTLWEPILAVSNFPDTEDAYEELSEQTRQARVGKVVSEGDGAPDVETVEETAKELDLISTTDDDLS